jgi:hypothetical protein
MFLGRICWNYSFNKHVTFPKQHRITSDLENREGLLFNFIILNSRANDGNHFLILDVKWLTFGKHSTRSDVFKQARFKS